MLSGASRIPPPQTIVQDRMTQTAPALTLVDRQISAAMSAAKIGPKKIKVRNIASNENKLSRGERGHTWPRLEGF